MVKDRNLKWQPTTWGEEGQCILGQYQKVWPLHLLTPWVRVSEPEGNSEKRLIWWHICSPPPVRSPFRNLSFYVQILKNGAKYGWITSNSRAERRCKITLSHCQTLAIFSTTVWSVQKETEIKQGQAQEARLESAKCRDGTRDLWDKDRGDRFGSLSKWLKERQDLSKISVAWLGPVWLLLERAYWSLVI